MWPNRAILARDESERSLPTLDPFLHPDSGGKGPEGIWTEIELADNLRSDQKMELIINPGRLNSVASLYFSLAPMLVQLRERISNGYNIEVVWDLTSAVPQGQNLSALASLLSVAKAIRQHMGRPSGLIIENNPALIEFWQNSGFFSLANESDLFDHDYIRTRTIPPSKTYSAKLLLFKRPEFTPDVRDKESFNAWKDERRPKLAREIGNYCRSIFTEASYPDYLKDGISMAMGELIVNAFVHGKGEAFVGLQSTRRKVTLCVSDSGIGFQASIKRKQLSEDSPPTFDDTDALVTACLMNRHEVGLLRAVDLAINENGSVLLSSNLGEIRWSKSTWNEAKKNLKIDPISIYDNSPRTAPYRIQRACDYLPLRDPNLSFQEDLRRMWTNPLKGARVEIIIPTKND